MENLKRTVLYDMHKEFGAKLVPFANYEMPVQYPMGILGEHLHTRRLAGLFDVSHMGQVVLCGADRVEALERLVPGDIASLDVGEIRYTFLTNDDGGIIDDLMVCNADDHLLMVVNSANCQADIDWLVARLPSSINIGLLEDRSLLSLQGPAAAVVMARLSPAVSALRFMTMASLDVAGERCLVSRSGYTGEDGFEISIRAEQAEKLVRILMQEPEVALIGLGARDSLRLEAGLCLHGADIDFSTTPVEAGLQWAISQRRREEKGFLGAEVIIAQISGQQQIARRRVGIRPIGKAPARADTIITDQDGNVIGKVTSGGFGPTIGGPVAMGYVESRYSAPGTRLNLLVRDVPREAEVVKLPFVAHRYFKG